jgi:Flp pilus assembly pilin Flp
MKSRISAQLARFFRDEEGPAAVEYAFFLSVAVVVVMVTLQVFS